MLYFVHILTGLILVAAHSVFLARGLRMRAKDLNPTPIDKVARLLSHFGLPLTTFVGFIVLITGAGDPVQPQILTIHILVGLTPFIAIIAFTPFLSLKRRIPWLLPAINLLLFVIAAVVGLKIAMQ